jgi:hypothetical protein
MASTLQDRFESSKCLPVGKPKNPCVDNEKALHHRTMDACQSIRNYPCIFERICRSMMRRVEACIGSHGGHSEYLI